MKSLEEIKDEHYDAVSYLLPHFIVRDIVNTDKDYDPTFGDVIDDVLDNEPVTKTQTEKFKAIKDEYGDQKLSEVGF